MVASSVSARDSALGSVLLLVNKRGDRPLYTDDLSDVFTGHTMVTGNKTVMLKEFRGRRALIQDRGIFMQTVLSKARDWIQLGHPNVARFYGISENYGPILTLVTEFYPQGAVISYLRTNPNTPKSPLIKGVVDGLQYLHEQNIVHGDLRGSNVLIDDTGAPRLVNYGVFPATRDFTTASIVGPPRWQPPELIEGDDEVGHVHWTTMSDVYSLGMLLLEILTEDKPFKEYARDAQVVVAVAIHRRRPRRPSHQDMPNAASAVLLNAVWDLLTKCWEQDPTGRVDVKFVNAELAKKA